MAPHRRTAAAAAAGLKRGRWRGQLHGVQIAEHAIAVRPGTALGWLPSAPGAEEGKPTLANRKSRIMRRRVPTHNTRANAPSHDFGYLRIRSLVLLGNEPSNEHAILHGPNEVIIGT
jgi:hypothetical protein